MSPRAYLAEAARENATAFDWAETEAAKVLIARHVDLDDRYQSWGVAIPDRIEEAFMVELNDIEVELDAIRDERLDEEVSNLSEADQLDDYLIEAIENEAPVVRTVLDAARKAARAAERLAA